MLWLPRPVKDYWYYGTKRNPEWEPLEKKIIVAHPYCAACGGKVDLQGHHKLPYHLFPEFELDENNVIVLCMNSVLPCHFVFGHLKLWTSYNREVDATAETYYRLITNRPN